MKEREFTVQQAFVGLLYEDGAFKQVLPPGRYEFPRPIFGRYTEKNVVLVDVRERSLTIKGQEILTKDKVAIRVSVLVYFRVVDPIAAMHNVASYEERIYEDVQLATRRFLASRDLEAILSDRNEISDAVREDVSAIAASYGVQIGRADVKDLAFPGNLREIMNQVLETERRGEAKLIEARREAEALRIKTEAENSAAKSRGEAQKEQIRYASEAERERVRVRLEVELEEARALAEDLEAVRCASWPRWSTCRRAVRFVMRLPLEDSGVLLERSDD